MKTTITSISILNLLAVCAMAADPSERGNKVPQNGKLGKVGIIERFDTGNDGQLSPDEKQAMRQQIAAKSQSVVDKYDTDKDGELSRSEFTAIPKAERRDLCPKTRNPSEQLPMRHRSNRNR